MTPINVIFCGSFLEYSAVVLEALIRDERLKVVAVLTTPAHPDKKGILQKNPVQTLAENAGLPIFTPAELSETVLQDLETQVGKPEILLTAGYGKLLPSSWLSWPSRAALNLHFSLLPKYRGANPAEWSLLLNEKETGITLITMSPKFDTGNMVAQAVSPLTEHDTRETVYQKLYGLGGEKISDWVVQFMNSELREEKQPPESPTPYAKRFQRDDGFISWAGLEKVMSGQQAGERDFSASLQAILRHGQISPDAIFVERAVRALAGFPSLWTLIPTAKGEKRMKILSAEVAPDNRLELDQVHIEGKAPARWSEVKNILV